MEATFNYTYLTNVYSSKHVTEITNFNIWPRQLVQLKKKHILIQLTFKLLDTTFEHVKRSR